MKLQRQIAKNRVALALPVALLMAANAWGYVTAHYIDENGRPAQNTTCTLINASLLNTVTFNNSAPCLVVDDTLEFDGHFYLTASDVTFIISDKAKLTINFNSSDGNTHAMDVLHNIKIFGQKNQAGSLIVNETGSSYSRGLSVGGTLQIYGGHIIATSNASDAIWANGNIDIYGGYVSATSTAANKDGIKSETGNININWVNSLYANSYSTPKGAVNFTNGLSLNGDNGTTYTGSNPSIAGITLTPPLLQFATNSDNTKRAIIYGDYTGKASVQSFNTYSGTEVASIDFNRTFAAGVPSTIVLPFNLPEGTESNAKFYRLLEVVQLENTCAWNATARNITKIDGIPNYPEANIPYIVLLDNGGKLTFDLHDAKATFQATSNPTITVSDDAWQFIGVYSFKEWSDNDNELGLAYGFAGSNEKSTPQGKFGKIAIATDAATTGYPHANPFRAYLKKRDENVKLHCIQPQTVLGQNSAQYSLGHDPETIDVQFIDEDENGEKTTFMARMNTRTGEFTMLRNYDLKGRKVNAATKAHGAYYGKKVIKK